MKPRRRLDADLVRRELAGDLDAARTLVADGRVTVDGAPTDNPARAVAPAEHVRVVPVRTDYVSRGGEKLAGALDAYGIDVEGRNAVDIGSSTGGFTDCLLRRGVAAVTCVDVGYGLLHEKVRADPRVTVAERTNVRRLPDDTVPGPFELVVGDLSFISLRSVVGPLLALSAPGATLLLLVKPQFESTRDEASRAGGVIIDPEVHERTVDEVVSAFVETGAAMMGCMESPIRGASGNTEFLVHLEAPAARVVPDG